MYCHNGASPTDFEQQDATISQPYVAAETVFRVPLGISRPSMPFNFPSKQIWHVEHRH